MAAYAFASAATVALMGAFGYMALGLPTVLLGGALTLLHGVLSLILRSTDHALLAGFHLAFFALAGTMNATSNKRWSAEPVSGAPETRMPPSEPFGNVAP